MLCDYGVNQYMMESRKLFAALGNSLEYSPLEQINGVTVPESDYYAAGVLLYHMCGESDSSEIRDMKHGKIPNYSGRTHEKLLNLTK